MGKVRFLSVIFLLSVSMMVHAQSMRALWLSMPDSILPYISKDQRKEMIDLADNSSKTEVNNLLNGKSVIDSVTDRYLAATVSGSFRIQMRLLPSSDGDSLLCVVRTFLAPEPESELRFYTRQWTEVPMRRCFENGRSLQELASSLLVRPDSMPESRFAELRKLIDPIMVSATLSPDNDSIDISLSLPLLSNDERRQINTIVLQRKLNWNGTTFN